MMDNEKLRGLYIPLRWKNYLCWPQAPPDLVIPSAKIPSASFYSNRHCLISDYHYHYPWGFFFASNPVLIKEYGSQTSSILITWEIIRNANSRSSI